MSKQKLAQSIMTIYRCDYADASNAIKMVTNGIKDVLQNSNEVQLIGFGKFYKRTRKARKGHNPRTGEEIDIKEATVPAFKAGSDLKKACK